MPMHVWVVCLTLLDLRNYFGKIWKYFGSLYFAEINFRMRKILRKFCTNVDKILGFQKTFDLAWKILKKGQNSLQTRKFVKCAKFQKIL